jgi:hypothetical protein
MIGVDQHKQFHLAVILVTGGERRGECSMTANRLG